jgi:nucleoside-diphosphate-sugar epimerase
MTAKPVDVISTEFDGTRNMLELAKEKGCISFLYLSSMEVYGQTKLHEVNESDLGSLDLSNPRSSYPEGKRLCEMLCVAYAYQYNLNVKIARLSQTFGAGTKKDDTRVFAQFARSTIAGMNIELHTEGKSKGNYCYTADTVRGLLTILLRGKPGEAYNISNPGASVTIREMAKIVASKVCANSVDVLVKVPDDVKMYGYASDVGYTISADKLISLGWFPKYGLSDMYKRMIEDWQERENRGNAQHA